MVEVGIRELKARLSYYVQLMQAGETVAIKMRDQVVGFLSKIKPVLGSSKKRHSRAKLEKLMQQWKEEGFLLSGGLYRHRSFKPVKLKGNKTTTELIREMRDEERY